MNQSYEEYLDHVAKYGETFSQLKKKKEKSEIKIGGPNNKWIYLKKCILLNYGSSEDETIIYIEDITLNKDLTYDLENKKLILHLSDTALILDFNTDYYYQLVEFETFEQFEYCQKYKELTIGLLNDKKTDILNKWTTAVNLL